MTEKEELISKFRELLYDLQGKKIDWDDAFRRLRLMNAEFYRDPVTFKTREATSTEEAFEQKS